MDRRLIYTGATPVDLDSNQVQQFGMISDGFLAEAVMGQSAWCYGLACAPTSPASMSLTVGRGCMGQMTVVDETNPGTSAIADTTDPLMKAGINLASTTLTFVAPATSGQSQVFLIEGQVQETDTGATVLQYFNPTPPYSPFTGPSNTGASNNTLRTQRVVLQVVAGAPAATGSQTAPGVTAGWVPLYLVTIANGATTLTSANIAVQAAAPFVLSKLGNVLPGSGSLTDSSNALTSSAWVQGLFGTFHQGFSNIQAFTTSGTFTVPAGVTKVEVICVGGGGPGTYSNSATAGNPYSSGSGGGAGGIAMGVVSGLTQGAAIAVAVGLGGVAVSSASGTGTGTTGGTSSFGAYMSATGGNGGSWGGAGSSGGGSGGVGSGGSLNLVGGDGGDGQGNGFTSAGSGAPGPWGGGGRAANSASGFGGHAPGAGGGGCYGIVPGFGGNGANGIVIIKW